MTRNLHMKKRLSATFVVLALNLAAAASLLAPARAANCSGTTSGLVPLTDLGAGTYQGQPGGLYPGGTNAPPAGYAAAGRRAAQAVTPRDDQGRPDTNGSVVLLSIGMSNTRLEFASFLDLERDDAKLDPHVVLVNGAQGGQDAGRWVDPKASAWSRAESQLLAAGVTDQQVQVIWLKQAQAGPTTDFETYRQSLASQLSAIVADAAARFPNLQQVFVSPRTYAGYATVRLNPEPYAYQTGFADRLLVAQSVAQPQARPWTGWGPYLWTDGAKGRSDGLTWTCDDVMASDGTHPSPQGAAKAARALQQFFYTSPFTPWFLAGGATETAPQPGESPLWIRLLVGALLAGGLVFFGVRRLTSAR